jgi:hypothetical protein
MKKRLCALLLFLVSISASFAHEKIVTVRAMAIGADATQSVLQALSDCRKLNAKKLIFEKGRYQFSPQFASEKYVYTSNNDHGLKSIVFDLSGIDDLEIDGQGSKFIFHGYVSPFLLHAAKNIKIRNLSIDYSRTFHSEGKIIRAYQDSLDLAFSPAYPYKVENNRLIFLDDRKTEYPFGHLLEFNTAKKEIAYMALDYINGVDKLPAKELANNGVRIYLKDLKGTVGNTLIFNAKNRLVPAFAISNSEAIEINNVTIFHAGGMGVIAQRSKNVLLDGLKVIAQTGRMVSLTADATHFANCAGKITIQNCVLENQMDDAGNIHGVYAKIEKILAPNQIVLKQAHFQQLGFDFLVKGSNIEFVTPADLATYAQGTVKDIERLNKEYLIVNLNQPISQSVKEGDIIGSLDDNPDLLIKNCTIQKNRARGFLLGTRGKVVVENNYFHTWWGAIDFYANGIDWFEQGGVRDVTIRNNVFDNCNFGLNVGLGVIIVLANIQENPAQRSYYNKNILIENNKFRIYNPTILSMKSVDGLVFRNNTVERNDEYKLMPWFASQKLEPFVFSNSINLKLQPLRDK